MLSKKEIFAYISLLEQYNEYKEATEKLNSAGRRRLKDQLVYRLMWDKKRSDDTMTDKFIDIVPEKSNDTI
jgi:hypothetical protein